MNDDSLSTKVSERSVSVLACPSCGSKEFTVAGPEAPGFATTYAGREFQQPAYAVHECSRCGLLYKNKTASPAELNEYYARVDFKKWEIPGYFPTERTVLGILRARAKGSSILDFGCSSGRLLAQLVNDYKCFGFEINKEAAGLAAQKGLNMLAPDFLESETTQRFDAVVLMDVFEHLSSPTDLLGKLFALLKPGGVLLLGTGNGDSAACRLSPAEFWYFRNIEHLCMLTRRNAEYLARVLDARLEHWREISHYDASPYTRLRQEAEHFTYWQFRRRTLLAKTILPLIPLVNRAKYWPIAPYYGVGRDHVIVGFSKA